MNVRVQHKDVSDVRVELTALTSTCVSALSLRRLEGGHPRVPVGEGRGGDEVQLTCFGQMRIFLALTQREQW